MFGRVDDRCQGCFDHNHFVYRFSLSPSNELYLRSLPISSPLYSESMGRETGGVTTLNANRCCDSFSLDVPIISHSQHGRNSSMQKRSASKTKIDGEITEHSLDLKPPHEIPNDSAATPRFQTGLRCRPGRQSRGFQCLHSTQHGSRRRDRHRRTSHSVGFFHHRNTSVVLRPLPSSVSAKGRRIEQWSIHDIIVPLPNRTTRCIRSIHIASPISSHRLKTSTRCNQESADFRPKNPSNPKSYFGFVRLQNLFDSYSSQKWTM